MKFSHNIQSNAKYTKQIYDDNTKESESHAHDYNVTKKDTTVEHTQSLSYFQAKLYFDVSRQELEELIS